MQNIVSQTTLPEAAMSPEQRPKSKFVTVIAWVSIVYWSLNAVFSTAVLFLVRFTIGDFLRGFEGMNEIPRTAGYLVTLMLQSIEPLLLLSILSGFVLIIASIGLLQRHNWARILYVVMIVLLILQSVIGGAFTVVVLFSFLPHLGSEAIPGVFGGIVGGLGSSAVYLALYGFVAWKLTRPDIRAEFH